jgi:hypothetical protein
MQRILDLQKLEAVDDENNQAGGGSCTSSWSSCC